VHSWRTADADRANAERTSVLAPKAKHMLLMLPLAMHVSVLVVHQEVQPYSLHFQRRIQSDAKTQRTM
jgi:hypothetical protein